MSQTPRFMAPTAASQRSNRASYAETEALANAFRSTFVSLRHHVPDRMHPDFAESTKHAARNRVRQRSTRATAAAAAAETGARTRSSLSGCFSEVEYGHSEYDRARMMDVARRIDSKQRYVGPEFAHRGLPTPPPGAPSFDRFQYTCVGPRLHTPPLVDRSSPREPFRVSRSHTSGDALLKECKRVLGADWGSLARVARAPSGIGVHVAFPANVRDIASIETYMNHFVRTNDVLARLGVMRDMACWSLEHVAPPGARRTYPVEVVFAMVPRGEVRRTPSSTWSELHPEYTAATARAPAHDKGVSVSSRVPFPYATPAGQVVVGPTPQFDPYYSATLLAQPASARGRAPSSPDGVPPLRAHQAPQLSQMPSSARAVASHRLRRARSQSQVGDDDAW